MNGTNGKNGWVVRSLAGFLFVIVLSAITALANNIIANDKECRTRLHSHEQVYEEKIEVMQKENAEAHQSIMVQLTRIETKLEEHGTP